MTNRNTHNGKQPQSKRKMTENEIYPRWEQKLDSYRKALCRLNEIVSYSKCHQLNEFEKDSVVKRFEYTHELAWKVMMSFCKFVEPQTELFGSRDSTRWAFSKQLITEGQTWMNMIKSRNTTAHNYDGNVAEEIISDIKEEYLPLLMAFYDRMTSIKDNSQPTLF